MQVIKQKAPSKVWSLVRNKLTGDYYTDDHAVYHTHNLIGLIDKAHDAVANGQEVPTLGSYRNRDKVCPTALEVLDHIPTVRGKLKYRHAHRGNSSVQIQFLSDAGGLYVLEGKSTDDFFRRVGEGRILMDANGFYEFNFSFIKKSETVFITLEPDDV